MTTRPGRKPAVAILATGGTIAGSGSSSGRDSAYVSASIGIDDLIAAVPDLGHIADLTGEQLLQIDSVNMDDQGMLTLARRVTRSWPCATT
jgi:glutamin-(asparagin-)ase